MTEFDDEEIQELGKRNVNVKWLQFNYLTASQTSHLSAHDAYLGEQTHEPGRIAFDSLIRLAF